MELMDRGSLTNVETYCECQEPHIAYFARKVLKALEYIHERRKIQRDIKSNNVLLKRNGEVKLGDFGYTAQLSSGSESLGRRSPWMTPEFSLISLADQLASAEEFNEF
jgi:p21-activated kinase 1